VPKQSAEICASRPTSRICQVTYTRGQRINRPACGRSAVRRILALFHASQQQPNARSSYCPLTLAASRYGSLVGLPYSVFRGLRVSSIRVFRSAVSCRARVEYRALLVNLPSISGGCAPISPRSDIIRRGHPSVLTRSHLARVGQLEAQALRVNLPPIFCPFAGWYPCPRVPDFARCPHLPLRVPVLARSPFSGRNFPSLFCAPLQDPAEPY
jgi:hypothetical protein